MRKFIFITALCILESGSLRAQLWDSLKSYLHQKPSLDWDWDTRNTIITARRAKVSGYKIGLDFASKLKIGFGISVHDSYHPYRFSISGESIKTLSLRMWYPCLYAEYVFHKARKWTFSVPVQLGFGRMWYQNKFYNPDYRTEASAIWLYEPCLSGEYRLLPWLGLSAEGGFRIVLYKNKTIRERLTAPIYVFSISIKWGYLMRKYGVYKKIKEFAQ